MSEYEPRTFDSILDTWEPRLKRRRGARKLMAGLDVYHDFPWSKVIGHKKTMFRNGKDLAERVREGCPDGKTPRLLLTEKDEVEDGLLYTNDSNYVVAIRIHKYLVATRGGAAANYLVGIFGVGSIHTMRRIREAVSNPSQQDEILDLSVTEEGLARWAGRMPGRVSMLRKVVGPRTTCAEVTEDGPTARKAARRLIRAGGPAIAQEVADELASTAAGRRAVTLADQLPGRMDDVRVAASDYRDLLAKPGASETDFQNFIKENPLLLGLEYAEVIPRVEFLRGEFDFVLRRHDGYRDLLELKGPNDPIIRFGGRVEHHASAYSLASKLAQALAQVHLYREWIATGSIESLDLYGVTRNPRITIVIGREDNLPNETSRKILRQLNLTLHRTRVLPYDILADRAEAQLDNVAKNS